MKNIIESFNKINSNIKKLQPKNPVNVVAVSKLFSFEYIKPLIDMGIIILVKIKYRKLIINGVISKKK